jgi:hypothetical protein
VQSTTRPDIPATNDVVWWAATSTTPALGALILREWLGRGIVAHHAPNSTRSYYVHATCGLVQSNEAYAPFAADMAVCPVCFDPAQSCPWCKTHCEERLAHQHLSYAASMAGKPTLMPDGTLRAAPDLRLAAA